MGVLQNSHVSAKAPEAAHGEVDETKKTEDTTTQLTAGAPGQSTEPASHNASSNTHNAPTEHADATIAPSATPVPDSKADVAASANATAPPKPGRGFSFRALAFLSNRAEVKPGVSTVQELSPLSPTSGGFFRRQRKESGVDKQAEASALVVRSLIVGPLAVLPASSKQDKVAAKFDVNKVKSQLLDPKTASKLIAQLRALPTFEGDNSKAAGPIHAVCLDTTDAEAEIKHFSRLVETPSSAESVAVASVATASIANLTKVFKDMHVVNLITAPDLGLGQPGDGSGILSGALPTAETVMNGIQMLTPQLMALGYATGKAVFPDHTGVYPPTDRMSVLTYWWGLELVLPHASMKYLASTESITHTIINFLTVLSALDQGVREILPFVRYIGQYVDFEFGSIQKQDHGQGVVCAATWIMPAALVPRPWDFAAPPPKPTTPINGAAAGLPRPSQATEASRPSESPSDMTSPMTPVSSLPPVLPEVVISSPNGTSTSNLIGI